MALVAAAVCPHPPLLVPEVGRGIDLASRIAAQGAVRLLVAADPELLVLVGADGRLAEYGRADTGSFARFGVDLTVPLDPANGASAGTAPLLPLSLTVGAWLLDATGWTGERQALGVPPELSGTDAAALGAELARRRDRVALLCMGDGSARRTEKAPGWLDERSAAFDRETVAALAVGEPARLAASDGRLAAELLVAGWTSWQVLAGAAAGRSWSADLLADEAPFGVGYHVAVWRPVDAVAAAAG